MPQRDQPLAGSRALVVGSRGNLGPWWCRWLREAGATIDALDEPGGAEVPDVRHRWEADVTDTAGVRAAADAALDVGPVDVLLFNAGRDVTPTATAGGASWEDVMAVNLGGFQNVLDTFEEGIIRSGTSVIAVGSVYAERAPDPRSYAHMDFDKTPMYGASKAAVVRLCAQYAVRWGASGARVNAISPGGVRGAQDVTFRAHYEGRVALGRMAEPEDLRGPIIFLASDASAYVTGINLVVDGGYGLI